MGQPGLFVYFRSFQTFYRMKIVHISGTRTQINRVEGKHADHLTTNTTAHLFPFYHYLFCENKNQIQNIGPTNMFSHGVHVQCSLLTGQAENQL